MIDPQIHDTIMERLKAAESDHEVKVLYACESGSRAWGFASPDSDYDIRFIYAHPQDWYLSFTVERLRDVIEYSIVDEIDISGWDIRKALYLYTRSNGALLEWLNSPIKYIEFGTFAEDLRVLVPTALNKTAICYHYSHLARSNAREHLFDDQVRLKKYFYVLRALLAIRYIEQLGLNPPVEFEQLVATVAPYEIRNDINKLLNLKRQSGELGYGKPINVINNFIQTEFARHGEAFKGQGRPDLQTRQSVYRELDRIFKDSIRWSS